MMSGEGALEAVPVQREGGLHQFNAEDRDNRVKTQGMGAVHNLGHRVQRQLEPPEHLDRISFARRGLVGGELGGLAHQEVGLEELELDRIDPGPCGGVCERRALFPQTRRG